MATEPVVRPTGKLVGISEGLRDLLHLTETETHYAVRTLSGATLMRPKTEIAYEWQLLRGIMDDGKDTDVERRVEREFEIAHDERKFGSGSRQ